MKAHEFSNSKSPLSATELEQFEKSIGIELPASFKAHYQVHNGGMPLLDWFPAKGNWEPIWLHEFLPILPIETTGKNPVALSIQSVYASGIENGLIQEGQVPFAVDPGGNFFCLDASSGAVSYQTNDSWSEGLTAAENRKKNTRRLTSSFDEFLDALVSEDEAYG